VAQEIHRPAILPLTDDLTIKDVFADACAGLNVLNGNVHLTFASVVADHTKDRAASKQIVSARVVIPIAGVVELRDMLMQIIDALAAQGQSFPQASESTVVTPLRKPS
jgi:hypothetical protein